jgi:sugar lactone lactonase YvrE
VTPDGSTLIVAESFGNKLTAFTIGDDGALSARRTWADLPDRAPDGICLDADGAVWVANANAAECVRVAEGGEILQTVQTGERRCFACALGGPDRRTLFLCVAEGFSGDAMRRRTGAIETTEVDVGGAGWP